MANSKTLRGSLGEADGLSAGQAAVGVRYQHLAVPGSSSPGDSRYSAWPFVGRGLRVGPKADQMAPVSCDSLPIIQNSTHIQYNTQW